MRIMKAFSGSRPVGREDRFENYRERIATYLNYAKCGHLYRRGETIAFHPQHGTLCPSCWEAWCADVAEENRYTCDNVWELPL